MTVKDLLNEPTEHDWFIAIILLTGIFLAIAVNYQVTACALCMTQRLAMVAGAIACAVGLIHQRIPLIYSICAGLFWVSGIGVALRQLWLQYVPGAVSNCGPGLEYQLANDYPLTSILTTMIRGSGDCAEPSVFPLLALGGFIVLLFVLGIHIRRRLLT